MSPVDKCTGGYICGCGRPSNLVGISKFNFWQMQLHIILVKTENNNLYTILFKIIYNKYELWMIHIDWGLWSSLYQNGLNVVGFSNEILLYPPYEVRTGDTMA